MEAPSFCCLATAGVQFPGISAAYSVFRTEDDIYKGRRLTWLPWMLHRGAKKMVLYSTLTALFWPKGMQGEIPGLWLRNKH